jgi:hypothetical protein
VREERDGWRRKLRRHRRIGERLLDPANVGELAPPKIDAPPWAKAATITAFYRRTREEVRTGLEEGNTGEPGGVDEACACTVGRRGAPWEREGGGEVPGAVERRGERRSWGRGAAECARKR